MSIYKTTMATLGMDFLNTINKLQNHDCKCNLLPMILKVNQMV